MAYEGKPIPEELRTELHFLYIESPHELNSNSSSAHTGLMQAHLSSAALNHDFALKYHSVCRDLHHVTSLTRVLSEASETTAVLREKTASLSADSITLPAIQGSGLSVHSHPPKPSAVKVPDLFEVLGPSSVFCAANSWAPPRTVSLNTRPHTTLGLCIGKSRPVIVTSVEPGGSAQEAGVLAGDWLMAVNGVRVVYLSHEKVVELLTTPLNDRALTLEITTPTIINS